MPDTCSKRRSMISLFDLQHAMLRGLVGPDERIAATHIITDEITAEARLDIYRNTVIGGLTNALRLIFPAVHRLVGPAFFETASRIFIEASLPDCAWLDIYGVDFPTFLAKFAPAAGLPYLPGVARLDWAVSQALHAPDAAGLDAGALSAVDPDLYGRIAFIPHPSIGLVEAEHPVDAIWRAVLDSDDAAMAALDLDAGPVRLLIQRGPSGIAVMRCDAAAWRFANDLFASRPLDIAFVAMREAEATNLLAEHLAAGRFAGFILTQDPIATAEEPTE